MHSFYSFKNALSWRCIQPHLCTWAVALSFGSSWRAPRAAYRYGGVPSAAAATVAAVVVALPAALLQLAVGQLSQQDAVGIWKAVPFFKGVGVLKLLISYIGAMYTVVYIAIPLTYIFYSLNNPVSTEGCLDFFETKDGDIEMVHNSTDCIEDTFLAPIDEQPEYYIALALIVIALWILFPFILYNPVKLMKRIFYAFGLMTLILGVIIVSAVGTTEDVPLLANSSDWLNFFGPGIWHSAVVQVLLSNQIAGGYLVSAGDSIYANTNVEWTTLTFVGANILAGWFGVLFWFAVAGSGDKETNNLAMIAQVLRVSRGRNLGTGWTVAMFTIISISGMITMLTLLYPVFDRLRRAGGPRWRRLAAGSSAAGAAGAVALGLAGPAALALAEDLIVPCLVSIAVVIEICAFVFIYGWKRLKEDIEFLLGGAFPKCWVWGWCSVPGVVLPFSLWWVVALFKDNTNWLEAPWEPIAVITSVGVASLLLSMFAAIAVARQVQYDILGKLKSSFSPSRHWGPRDPITHHYWLARREGGRTSAPRARFRRHRLGQLSTIASSSLRPTKTIQDRPSRKQRSSSDDLLIISRKNLIANLNQDELKRRRTKSVDWDTMPGLPFHIEMYSLSSVKSESENNNNIVMDVPQRVSKQ